MKYGTTRLIVEAVGIFLVVHRYALKEILVSVTRMAHRGMHTRAAAAAWLLEARQEVERVDPTPLVPRYTAEVYYTRSVIARELGALDEAEREARGGLACALRAASRRNGHHVLGAALLARGDVEAGPRPGDRARSGELAQYT